MTTGIYLFIVYIYWISIASRKNESLFAHRIIGLNCFQLICRNESHRITIHGHFNIHRVRLLIKFFQNLWASGKQLCFFKNVPLILLTAFTQCRFQNQLIVDWCAEIKKLLSAQQPSANDLWAQAAAAARKIEANLYYQTHGGFIAPDGRKLKGEDFKKENAKIFAALPMVVQRWAGSPADLSEIFSSRSSADLRQFVRPGFDRAVQDAPVESLQPPALPGGAAPAQIGGGTA